MAELKRKAEEEQATRERRAKKARVEQDIAQLGQDLLLRLEVNCDEAMAMMRGQLLASAAMEVDKFKEAVGRKLEELE